jgi:hypothetical protein
MRNSRDMRRREVADIDVVANGGLCVNSSRTVCHRKTVAIAGIFLICRSCTVSLRVKPHNDHSKMEHRKMTRTFHNRAGQTIARRSVKGGYGEVMDLKVDLISSAREVRSLRDFGGLYIVHGKYLLEPAVSLGCSFASMIDVTPVKEFEVKIARMKAEHPNLEVEFVQADFREHSCYASLRPVDLSIVFEVLLHQENYAEVLRNICARSSKYICIAQPCLREAWFSLPSSATLLQFWPEELKSEVRQGSFWPPEPETETFTPKYWMWGHTVSHLIDMMRGFGWSLDYGDVVDNVCGEAWEYALLRFRLS